MQWTPCPECGGPVYRTRHLLDSAHRRECPTKPSWDELFESFTDPAISAETPRPYAPDPALRVEAPKPRCATCGREVASILLLRNGSCGTCAGVPRPTITFTTEQPVRIDYEFRF